MTEHGNRTPLCDMLHVHYSQQHNQAAPLSYFRVENVVNQVTVLKVEIHNCKQIMDMFAGSHITRIKAHIKNVFKDTGSD